MSNYRKIIDRELESMTFNEVRSRRSIEMKHKIKIKKINIAAAAVCAVMLSGITAAAASGGFSAVFGKLVSTADNELADSLMGEVSNVRYNLSDKDYTIGIKGVTGDRKNIIMIAEISRIDGTPVKEHFLTDTDETKLAELWNDLRVGDPNNRSGGGKWETNINESGNIDILLDWSCSDALDGYDISIGGVNFYPNDAYYEFMSENKIFRYGFGGEKGYFVTDENGNTTDISADIDDISVKLIDLEWELSFRFKPSETSLKKLYCEAPEQGFTYYQDVYEAEVTEYSNGRKRSESIPDTLFTAENQAVVSKIEIGALDGVISFEYPASEYEFNGFAENGKDHIVTHSEKNEVFLIKNDGDRITVKMRRDGGFTGYGTTEHDTGISYTDANGSRILVNTDEITSISINGTIYELS